MNKQNIKSHILIKNNNLFKKMMNLTGIYNPEVHKQGDTQSTVLKTALKKGFCSIHHDVRIDFMGFNKPCKRCEEEYQMDLNRKKAENDLAIREFEIKMNLLDNNLNNLNNLNNVNNDSTIDENSEMNILKNEFNELKNSLKNDIENMKNKINEIKNDIRSEVIFHENNIVRRINNNFIENINLFKNETNNENQQIFEALIDKIEKLESENNDLKLKIDEIKNLNKNENDDDKTLLINETYKKIRQIEFMVNRLNKFYPLVHVGVTPNNLWKLGYVSIPQSNQEHDYFFKNKLPSIGWLYFRDYNHHVQIKSNKLKNYTGYCHEFKNLLYFDKKIMNMFSNFYRNTVFNEIFDYDDEKVNIMQNDEIRLKCEKKNMFYQIFYGHSFGCFKCDDFEDLSGGLNTKYHEIKVLEYIHFKMTNLRDYFYEIMIDKEPTFELE